MNKYSLCIILLLFFSGAFAQTTTRRMELMPNGYVGPDSTKNYIVIDVPNVNKADLYKKTLTYINGLYGNPQKVVSAVDGESITINASTDAVQGFLPLFKYPMTYSVLIEFKDGKLKFEPKVLNIEEVSSINGSVKPFDIIGNASNLKCIWMKKRNGDIVLVNPELKKSLDTWVNKYISGIISKVNESW